MATTNVTSSRVLSPFDESPEMSPEAFYSVASRPNFQQTEYESENGHLPSYRDTDLADRTEEQDSNVPEESPKSGYNLLASNISSSGDLALTPIYRKFERLNNRVLLHLQDEIMGLENYRRRSRCVYKEQGSIAARRFANAGRRTVPTSCYTKPNQCEAGRI